MVHITRQFHAEVDPARAVEFLADFSNATIWDPGTVSCVRLQQGPLQVGNTWANTSRFLGRTTQVQYELLAWTDTGVHFFGHNDTVSAHDRIDVLPEGSGARVTYDARLVFGGVGGRLDPLLHLVFLSIARDTVRDLTRALEEL